VLDDFARGQFSRYFIFAFSLHFVLVQRNDINSYYEYSHRSRNGG